MIRHFAPVRIAGMMACLALLAACVAPGGGAAQKLAVSGGQVLAAVPGGFCIQPDATLDSPEGSVLIATRCNAESASPAVLSISIGGTGSSEVLKSGAKALSDWFLSPAGRAALARDGRAQSVRVLQSVVADGVLLLHLNDVSVGDYWRAVLGMRGRLVTISATGPAGSPLAPELSRKVVKQTISALRAANPATKN
jgi:hypothetical protein